MRSVEMPGQSHRRKLLRQNLAPPRALQAKPAFYTAAQLLDAEFVKIQWKNVYAPACGEALRAGLE